MDSRAAPRHAWEQRFARLREPPERRYERWLDRWQGILQTSRHRPVLDLGCGSGADAEYLTTQGFAVLAGDFSANALRLVCQAAPVAGATVLDLRGGLPFLDCTFQVIVANLCLHYFRWDETERIVADVRRCLRPGGYLLARVNSTQDHNYGAVGYEEVEERCYLVDGLLKRFFAREDVERLFGEGWQIHGLEEQEIHPYRHPKWVWEVVVENSGRTTH